MMAGIDRPLPTSRVVGPRHAAPLSPLDPRTAPWRPDLADIALAGVVAVPAYVRPALMRVAAVRTPLLETDCADSRAASELLLGEPFRLLDSGHGHGWGQGGLDGHIGHVAMDALAAEPVGGGWTMVGPDDALLFAAPGIKAPVVASLPMGARLPLADHDEHFLEVAAGPFAGAFLHRRHARGGTAADWVAVAERFLGSPYRWGGRTRAGVDCSGLVQISRQQAGRACRRDSDMQAADAALDVGRSAARRGDLACWPGHVGIMVDGNCLLHANAHWMAVVVEPLAAVEARIGAAARLGRFAD